MNKAACILALLLIFSPTIDAVNVSVTFKDSDGDAIENVTFAEVGGDSTTSDATGTATLTNLTADPLNLTATYPSSAYSAAIDNLTVSTLPPINGFITVSLRLRNTLGNSLEAQDCAVSILDADGILFHTFDTTCRLGDPYLDDLGNWVSPSDCPLTDSHGNYNFKGKLLEADGFRYNQNYTLKVVCNDIEETAAFTTGLPLRPDVSRRITDIQYNAGVYVFVLFVLFLFAGMFSVLYYAAKSG